ncbi:phosphatase PAP2 family protein [Francisella adeliensis]|uniref:Phosphatase PAP2 family protein n=1 Tax=Francisella adeliensis TaxID=2007306 RepID=A0A2Z4XXJ7_9GAMM|nr:phosphatase PAP2 family protein [Francisella adeliensis]AXA33450.1 phosphatase PAP2 family protein [Francisella adeliensis]MBK2085470.1 phosphatase PAP2 family protein [Francisella adeliensis]MBK2097200.1 phosphatase PAP2 family protein [Francisella adeliensis]QIW11678.1 phosphatase PAP2 family protein [Francisella adeliensis]QIW13553.1 phosphatase PAP2 family protein [Francisella adeliensis]
MKNKNLVLLSLTSIFFIVICYFFVDRQVVWFAHNHDFRQYTVLYFLSDHLVNIINFMVFFFYIYYFIKLVCKRVSGIDSKFIFVANAILIGQFIKEILKGVFGRYWAATFRNNNPSLIHDNAYGFNWFKFSSDYASFPSGHATFIFSFAVSMWILFPKFRWFYGLLAFLVTMAQLLQYFHYASDLIAGATLGSIVAVYTCGHYKNK